MLRMLGVHLCRPQPRLVWIHLQYSCKKYPDFSITFVLPPNPSLLFSQSSWKMGLWVPSEDRLSISVSNGCQMCVWGGRSVSVFHVSSQRDEQGSSWRWTETALASFTVPPLLLFPPLPPPASFVLTLSCCNILALIKANKGSKKKKTFRNCGGEEDVSRWTRQRPLYLFPL